MLLELILLVKSGDVTAGYVVPPIHRGNCPETPGPRDVEWVLPVVWEVMFLITQYSGSWFA